ncbi:MAG: flagellar basal body L-ring protein FlgH [Planctomycetota bacterium]
MKTRVVLMLLLTGFLLTEVNCLHANSIWSKRGKNMKDLYADDVARQIGDTLTIIITEDSKVDNKAKRDLKKETDKSIVFNGEIGKYVDIGDFGLEAESTNELKSKADYKDERSFEDRVSVVVVDVLPNRNLVVLGTRSRDIAGDKQTIEISGIVRPSDIAFDNTVRSAQVADFRIVSKNSGYAEPYTRPGWFGRMLDIIWPF